MTVGKCANGIVSGMCNEVHASTILAHTVGPTRSQSEMKLGSNLAYRVPLRLLLQLQDEEVGFLYPLQLQKVLHEIREGQLPSSLL